jgi:hypothetical protein
MGGNPLKQLGNGLATVVTGGLNHTKFGRKVGENIGNTLTLGTGRLFKNPQAPGAVSGGTQDPAAFLAQTGGASLLASIAMGVDVDEALAGYMGVPKEDLDGKNGNLNAQQVQDITSARNQLNSIQSNRQLRQQAVDKVIADFPNIAKYAAEERAKSGTEFDSETKKYMDQALGSAAAKYNVGGMLSSGAANEAFAKVGADQAMSKLDYMGGREQYAYNTRLNETNARLTEVNALRDFQNTMMTGQVAQGFSAQQAQLQRQFQGDMFNAEQANQRYLSDQQSKNALYGGLGQLGGTIIGASLFGPPGAMLGGQIGSGLGSLGNSGFSSNPRLNLPQLGRSY